MTHMIWVCRNLSQCLPYSVFVASLLQSYSVFSDSLGKKNNFWNKTSFFYCFFFQLQEMRFKCVLNAFYEQKPNWKFNSTNSHKTSKIRIKIIRTVFIQRSPLQIRCLTDDNLIWTELSINWCDSRPKWINAHVRSSSKRMHEWTDRFGINILILFYQ